MAIFSYKAASLSGKVIKGTFDLDDEKEVVAKLRDMGYIPIKIARAKPSAAKIDVSRFFLNIVNRVSSKDVLRFTLDLSALLKAGLPIDRALGIILDTIEKKRFREIVEDILKSVHGGTDLSGALARHPGVFSEFYINMVKAGEAGGVLESALDRMGEFLETSQELKDYIASSLAYPVFLVIVGGLSIIILMIYVIPKFAIIFSDLGDAIPMSTRILLVVSQYLRAFWWLFPVMAAAGIFSVIQYQKRPGGREKIDRWKMGAPVIGGLIRKIEVARFARTLGTLIKSGVPILKAIDLVKDIMSNKIICRAMANVYNRVKEGDRLSRPLEDARIFPNMAVKMITVGEESGNLENMLIRVAENYEKAVKNTIRRFISLLEPAMILCMGVIVAFIVISMLTAIFSMNDMPF